MRARVLAFGFALLLAGCGTQPAVVTPLPHEAVQALARVARTETGRKQSAALAQLREVALSVGLDNETLLALRDTVAEGSDALNLERILATGGNHVDRTMLKGFQAGNGHAVALALAARPAPDVTTALVEMAASEEVPAAARRLCRLILAARGEKGREWTALVVSDVLRSGRDASARGDDRQYLEALGGVASKLSERRALREALFERLYDHDNGVDDYLFLSALAALASCDESFSSGVQERKLRGWLDEKYGGGNGPFFLHIVPACFGIDTGREMTAAMASLPHGGINSDKVEFIVEKLLAPLLTRKDVRAEIRRGLSSKDRDVRLGAVVLLLALGPDAAEMLSDVEKLLFDDDADVRKYARQAFTYVAGLNAEGEWCAEIVPRHRELIRRSLDFPADVGRTP